MPGNRKYVETRPVFFATRHKSSAVGIALLVAWGALLACGSPDGWRGKVEERDGVLYVTNRGSGSATGDPREELELLWSTKQPVETSAGEESALFAGISWLEVDSAGDLFVLDAKDHRVTHMSPSGEILGTFGRFGQGPGELSGMGQAVWASERFYISNRNNGRIEVFDAMGHDDPPIQLAEVKQPVTLFFREPYFYVGHSPPTEGFILHRYGRDWQPAGSVGVAPPIEQRSDFLKLLYMTRTGPDAIWLVYSLQNRIQKLDFDGRLLLETSRELDWALPRDVSGEVIPERPIHRAADVDPQGDLYVVFSNKDDLRRGNEVFKFGADGRLHGHAFDLPIYRVTMIRFDAQGHFYFSDGIDLYKARIHGEEQV